MTTLRNIWTRAGGWAKRAWAFARTDVWDIELSGQPLLYGGMVRVIRIVQLVFKGFREDECPLNAAALTFNTLMSIVPVLAVSLALARGLGGAEAAREQIQEAVGTWTKTFSSPATNAVTNVTSAAGNAVAAVGTELEGAALAQRINAMVDTGFSRVEEISFTALGGTGLAILIWMTIAVLGRVEGTFNRVWGVSVGRSMWRKFTDYLSILVVLPLLIVAASSLPVADFATRFLDDPSAAFVRRILDSGPIRGVTVLTLTALCFAFVIMFMPNTKVRTGPALTGGVVTALLFLGWLWACAAFQVAVARNSKIYGSFALVPIVLAWVYMSWQIILFGAETAFAVQNCATYRMEQGAARASFHARTVLAVSVAVAAARAMLSVEKGFEVSAYARKRRVPVRLLQDVVDDLVKVGLLAAVAESDGRYVLLKTPERLKVGDVIEAMSDQGVPGEALGLEQTETSVREAVEQYRGGGRGSVEGLTILELAGQTA